MRDKGKVPRQLALKILKVTIMWDTNTYTVYCVTRYTVQASLQKSWRFLKSHTFRPCVPHTVDATLALQGKPL